MAQAGVYADYPIPDDWWEILSGLSPVRYRWRGRPLPSLGALVDACLQLLPLERRALVWQRFGVAWTLQDIGDAHGITRERVRQVVNTVTRRFVKTPEVRRVLDGVFSGLGSGGALVVNVQGARSVEIPEARPDELWTFIMSIWREVQKRPAVTLPLGDGLHLFAPDGLPDVRKVQLATQGRTSFMHAGQLAALLGVHPSEVEVVACAFPFLQRTRSGLYGSLKWTQPQLIKAVAEQLARAGVMDWHYSTVGKAAAVFDESLRGQSSRNFAAAVSRRDCAHWFESAGRNGFWRLAALGDGHPDNLSAIEAVLAEADTPLHWRDVQTLLQRTVNDGTVVALLSREPRFMALGAGVFGLAARSYAPTEQEDQFMMQLFDSCRSEVLPAEQVYALAETRRIEPSRLALIGRYSTAFRYWRWGDNDPLFMTPSEANRRTFQRWFAQRELRAIPGDDVLTEGLKDAATRHDDVTIRATLETLSQAGHSLPGQLAGLLSPSPP